MRRLVYLLSMLYLVSMLTGCVCCIPLPGPRPGAKQSREALPPGTPVWMSEVRR